VNEEELMLDGLLLAPRGTHTLKMLSAEIAGEYVECVLSFRNKKYFYACIVVIEMV
jgi:hypothetical protein